MCLDDETEGQMMPELPADDTCGECAGNIIYMEGHSLEKEDNCNKINTDRTSPFFTTDKHEISSANVSNLFDKNHIDTVPGENFVPRNNSAQPVAYIDPEYIFTRDDDGDTLLHTAIIVMDLPNSMTCISKAPTYTCLSLTNLLFQTPLHLAALTDQPDIVRRLVVAGADVTSQDKAGNTALHIACRDGKLEVLKNLLRPVHYSETKENMYEIPYQEIPQDFTVRNFNGHTCLHLAALSGHLNIVEALIEYDVDMNMKEGKTGRTVLHNACLRGDINLVKLLIRHKVCDINARAFDGNTPFDLARVREHDHVCLALAAEGARLGEQLYDSE